jgi:phage gpG-like protein
VVTMTRYQWVPDPQLLANSFFTVEEALRDRTLPLAYAAEQTLADVRERFETKTDPEGMPWEPWSDGYAEVAAAYPNIDMLRRDDVLYESVIASSQMVVTNDTVFFEANMPVYGAYHQEGAPGRRTASGKANPLPKRAFLGLSEGAVASIFVAFSEWFDKAIDLYPTVTGRVGRRHSVRGMTGTFIPRSAPMPVRVSG